VSSYSDQSVSADILYLYVILVQSSSSHLSVSADILYLYVT